MAGGGECAVAAAVARLGSRAATSVSKTTALALAIPLFAMRRALLLLVVVVSAAAALCLAPRSLSLSRVAPHSGDPHPILAGLDAAQPCGRPASRPLAPLAPSPPFPLLAVHAHETYEHQLRRQRPSTDTDTHPAELSHRLADTTSPPRPQAHPTRFLARCSALAWQGSIGQSIDNAAFEVQPGATRRINESTRVHSCTFYLSFAARRAPLSAPTFASIGAIIKRDRSVISLLTAVVREVIVWVFTCIVRLGGASQRRAACEHLGYCPREWAAHDGVLSVHGQRAPLGETWRPLPAHFADTCAAAGADPRGRGGAGGGGASVADPDGPMGLSRTPSTREACAPAPKAPSGSQRDGSLAQETRPDLLEPGVWHVLELEMDHFAVCGGPLASPRCVDEFWDVYVRVRSSFPAPSE